MSEPQIGYWVRRRTGKWHLVESVIEDRAVVRCGREMRGWIPSGGELQVSEVMPLTRMIGQPQLCKAGCDPDVDPAFVQESKDALAEFKAEMVS